MLVMRALRRLEPETAQAVVFCALRIGLAWPVRSPKWPRLQTTLWGMQFSNPIGFAAGVDKSARVFDKLFNFGPSFIEIGTVTPRPQSGNAKPRIFRLEEDKAVINRLGFNNDGMNVVLNRLIARRQQHKIIGANIGINSDTADYISDYLAVMSHLCKAVDYLVVNVSSPNTPGLRDLQQPEKLHQLLSRLIEKRGQIASNSQWKPILVKISPDLSEEEERAIASVAVNVKIDGMIVSNTTIRRQVNLTSPYRREKGGLSGAPLFSLSTDVLRRMYMHTGGKIPLIGVGGVFSGSDAYAKIRAGASLVQLYTALIYCGRRSVYNICKELNHLLERDGFANVAEAVGVDVHGCCRENDSLVRRRA